MGRGGKPTLPSARQVSGTHLGLDPPVSLGYNEHSSRCPDLFHATVLHATDSLTNGSVGEKPEVTALTWPAASRAKESFSGEDVRLAAAGRCLVGDQGREKS